MIRIRKAKEADYQSITDLVERAYRKAHDSRRLSLAEMRDSELFIPELSLVAEMDKHRIVGHIYLVKVSINDVYPSLGLAHVAVDPKYQGLGIGALIVYYVHQEARKLGYGSVVSVGCKKFLSKLGYRTVSNFGINFPFGVVEDQCIAAELYPGALNEVHGMVSFPLEYM